MYWLDAGFLPGLTLFFLLCLLFLFFSSTIALNQPSPLLCSLVLLPVNFLDLFFELSGSLQGFSFPFLSYFLVIFFKLARSPFGFLSLDFLVFLLVLFEHQLVLVVEVDEIFTKHPPLIFQVAIFLAILLGLLLFLLDQPQPILGFPDIVFQSSQLRFQIFFFFALLSSLLMLAVSLVDVGFFAWLDCGLRNRLVLCASVWCAELLFLVVTHFINFIPTINPNNKYHVFCRLNSLRAKAKGQPLIPT